MLREVSVRSGVVPAMRALVPRALAIEPEQGPLSAVRAVPDDVPGGGLVLPGIAVPFQRLEVLLVQHGILQLLRAQCHPASPFRPAHSRASPFGHPDAEIEI